jgi:hypothetical protein
MKAIGFEAVGFAKGFRHVFTIEGIGGGFYLPILGLERDTTRTKAAAHRGCCRGRGWKQIHAAGRARRWRSSWTRPTSSGWTRKTSDDLLDPVADLYQLRGKPSAPVDRFERRGGAAGASGERRAPRRCGRNWTR